MQLTYYTSGGSGDAGDQYTGLDRFGRVVDQRWDLFGTNLERVKYGYDQASNQSCSHSKVNEISGITTGTIQVDEKNYSCCADLPKLSSFSSMNVGRHIKDIRAIRIIFRAVALTNQSRAAGYAARWTI